MMSRITSRTRGLTLLELMVTIAVLAVLATIAIPSFQETIRSNQVASQTNELISLLHLARNEAVRRNLQGDSVSARTMRVELASNGSVWEAFVHPPGDDETADGCPQGAIRCSEGRSVTLSVVAPSGSSLVRFDNRGYSVNIQGAPVEARLQLIHDNATSDRHRRCVRVFPGGQVAFDEGVCGA